jgi:peroxiredoxin
MKKVETTKAIDGKAVVQVAAAFCGFTVYEWAKQSHVSEKELLFVNAKGEFCGRLEISADCGQNTGYVSDVSFHKE